MKNAHVAEVCINLASTFVQAAKQVDAALSVPPARLGEEQYDLHTRCQLETQRARALCIVSELMRIAEAASRREAAESYSRNQEASEPTNPE